MPCPYVRKGFGLEMLPGGEVALALVLVVAFVVEDASG